MEQDPCRYRTMSPKFIAIALLLAAAAGWTDASADTDANARDDTQVLTRMLDEFLAGASVNDAAAHDRFWADELVYTSSAGKRFGKREILDGLHAEQPAPVGPAVVYSAEDVRVLLFGGTAVVAFRLLGTGQGDGGAASQYLNTGTFLKRDGEWRAVAWQATRVPEPD